MKKSQELNILVFFFLQQPTLRKNKILVKKNNILISLISFKLLIHFISYFKKNSHYHKLCL